MIDTDNNILHEYDKNKNLYIDFLEYFKNTITGIISNELIVLQSIDSRCKERESLNKKIQLKQKYRSIHEITDICGMRIITYFSDDVDRIANILREEFEIDEDNSVDKRGNDDPTKFGYVSLHYVASLKDNRVSLLEAKRFRDLKIEIQIRTILQHAWAEIEHDLGYKSEKDIPKKIKRQFSRLASHIELADEEFVRIKQAIKSYSTELENNLKSNMEDVLIDMVSLTSFVQNDEQYLKTLEKYQPFLPNSIKFELNDSLAKNIISIIIQICNELDIDSIKELKDVYMKYVSVLEKFFREQVNLDLLLGMRSITPLISILKILNIAGCTTISDSKFFEIATEDDYDIA